MEVSEPQQKMVEQQQQQSVEQQPLPTTQQPLTTTQQPLQQQNAKVKKPNENPLIDVEIVDENVSLNLLVSFLTLANKRGAFTLEEAHKVWECVMKFKQ